VRRSLRSPSAYTNVRLVSRVDIEIQKKNTGLSRLIPCPLLGVSGDVAVCNVVTVEIYISAVVLRKKKKKKKRVP
jgi:hypothetical protein